MFPTAIHEIHTNECVKPQQAAKNTVSASGFKWIDITCVADQKSNSLQYHENTRVITGAETVTKHLAFYHELSSLLYDHTSTHRTIIIDFVVCCLRRWWIRFVSACVLVLSCLLVLLLTPEKNQQAKTHKTQV